MKINYNIIFLKNKFKFKNNVKLQENVIKSPKTCPFCGEKEALNEINFYYGKKRNYYVKLCVCKKHNILKSRFLVKPFLIATIPVISLMILTILFPKFSILYIIIFCCFTSFIVPSLFRIYGNFWIEYFKNESIIYVRRNDWCEEFLLYNEDISRKFTGDLTRYENMKVKLRKLKSMSLVIFIVTVITIIISFALNWIPLFASLSLFITIYFCLYGVVDLKLYRKAENIKKEIFFRPNE